MNVWVYIWLGVFVATLVVEFFTFELVSVWIAVGALVSMVLAICGVALEIQIIVCVAVSIACLLGLRRVALKFLNRNSDKTNVDLVVGQRVKIISEVNEDNLGTVRVNGVLWSVKSEDDKPILPGEYATVTKVDGNKLVVARTTSEKKSK